MYADILIITNIYADYLLLCAVSVMTRSRLKRARALLASAVGSLFSLTIFLPPLSAAGQIGVKLLAAAAVVYAAYGFESRKAYIKRLFVFFLTSFVFAGAGTAAASLTGGRLLISRNGNVYADFSMPVLVASTVAAYCVIHLYKRLTDASDEGGIYTVTAVMGRKTVVFKAMADTGNTLCDSITGKPVIVVNKAVLEDLCGSVPCEEELMSAGGAVTAVRWRLIPCKTVSGTCLIPITRPDELYIRQDGKSGFSSADVYLGAAAEENEYAVFDPKILL